jgi:hypothetical protein
MSQSIKGTVPSGGIPCACGKRTVTKCYFDTGGTHGVCIDCGSAHLVKFSKGFTASRLVCKRCVPLHRAEIWETALYDTLQAIP